MQAEQFKLQAALARGAEILAKEIEYGADLLTRNQMLAQRVQELEEENRALKASADAEEASSVPDFD